MKNSILFFLAVLAISFSSCEKIKDASAVDIDSQLTANIPISTIDITAMAVKSVQLDEDVFTFGGSATFSLSDDDELVPYLNKIREIKAKDGTVLSVLGAVEGNKILSLTLRYGFQTGSEKPTLEKAFSIPSEILANAGLIEFYSDAWTAALMSKIEANKDKTVFFELTGTANYDIETTVKLKIPMVVSASPL